eukprot:scaffold255061_cov58-Attheya_sp.AAC.1
MLTDNKMAIAANWHPPTPIEDLFEQLRVGKEFAIEGGDAMSVQEQVRLGYNIIDETGLFTNACRDWRILPPPRSKLLTNSSFTSRDGIVTVGTPTRRLLRVIMGRQTRQFSAPPPQSPV